MNTVFPVELCVQEEPSLKGQDLTQAFTRDVSAGGMCLEVRVFGKNFERAMEKPGAELGLTINPTFSRAPIKAIARVAWLRKSELAAPRYLIGITYTQIDDRAKSRLIGHARWLVWLPRLVWTAGSVMAALLIGLYIHDQTLIRENKELVSQIVESASKKSDIASQLYELQRRKTLLDDEIEKSRKKIDRLEKSMVPETALSVDATRQTHYQKQLADIVSRQADIKQKIQTIQSDRQKLQSSYRVLEVREKPLAISALKQMFGWLQSHQNFHTGLVVSYEGDESLKDVAFTYDQSLAAQTFLLFDDLKNAEAILSFFEERAAKSEGGFFNAYDTVDGRSTENTVNTGPNLWLGIAALQYEHRAKNGRFLPLAKRVADWALGFQDEDGGLSGGPSIDWYSTEHNLDAYAFFSMLAQETGDARYKNARERSLEWIKKYAYSATEGRMQRGKGDATIATDTFSWALAALGPEALGRIGSDAEDIMKFAEANCEVSVEFIQSGGKSVTVRGFDFARAQNVGRGGIISTEWTAQMIVAYRVLSEHFKSLGNEDKSLLYSDKANFYLSELQKMIITSPSKMGQGRGCLPYASHDNVDTGHGWRSPKGRSTGSVAGTAYAIFAWSDYNPFDLEILDRKKSAP